MIRAAEAAGLTRGDVGGQFGTTSRRVYEWLRAETVDVAVLDALLQWGECPWSLEELMDRAWPAEELAPDPPRGRKRMDRAPRAAREWCASPGCGERAGAGVSGAFCGEHAGMLAAVRDLYAADSLACHEAGGDPGALGSRRRRGQQPCCQLPGCYEPRPNGHSFCVEHEGMDAARDVEMAA